MAEQETYQPSRNGNSYSMNKRRRFQQLAANRLGVIDMNGNMTYKVRNDDLEWLDRYYEGTQYDHLVDWDEGNESPEYVSIRKRKPRIIFPFAKILSSRVASKLVGHTTFPSLTIVDDPDSTEFIKVLLEVSNFKSRILEPIRRTLNTGSCFLRFFISGTSLKMEWYLSKYCYPKFDINGDLSEIEIKYIYTDENDKNPDGSCKKKWFKLYLSTSVEIEYNNPEYKPGVVPEFEEVDRVEHNLGFVQGEWLRTSEEKFEDDGESLIEDSIDFIDSLNYSLSQTDQAVAYNQDPQVLINKMDEEEIDELIRSSSKAWNLGREGEAKFLEAGLKGVETAGVVRDKMKLSVSDATRVVFLDPEKIVGNAQSAKAMEVLHGPFVDLINELRPIFQKSIVSLVTKMAVAVLTVKQRGFDSPVIIPDGFQPKSLAISATWPAIFPLTTEDLTSLVGLATKVTTANIFSREWAARWLAKNKEFGIEDIELELQKVASQPVINPFGGF